MKFRILDSSRITIIIFILITLLFIFISLLNIYEAFSIVADDGVPEYLKHKGRCMDCEKQFINMYGIDSAWRGQQSSSYDSEKQGVDMYGEAGGAIGKTLKYY